MENDRNKLQIKMGIVVRGYFIFPLAFGCLLAVLTAAMYFISETGGLISTAILLAYGVGLAIFFMINNKNFERGLVRFARQYGGLEGELISDFPIPYVITDPDGRIIAYNRIFGNIYEERGSGENISNVFETVTLEDLNPAEETGNISVTYEGREYRLVIKRLKVTKDLIESKVALLPHHDMTLCIIYMFDETETINLTRKLVEEQPAVGSVYVDNFEELISRNMDIQQNINIAMLDKIIGEYFSKVEGIVRKLERDRYFVVFKKKYLATLQRTKFEILDQVRTLEIGEDRSVTLSIGIGTGPDFLTAEQAAESGLELALGRGGDQVVVKEGARIYYYGGKTRQAEKNTRVKARVKAKALRDIMISRDRVVIMGHKNCDMDSFAAAVGIHLAAKALGKPSYIILNRENNTIRPALELFREDSEYSEGVFITPEYAFDYVDESTALVIVDVNKPEIFEIPDLIQRSGSVVLIDHHLQSGDRIDNLVLSYIDPTASSASEMVADMIPYIADQIKLRKLEAEALYGGIVIDTDSFTKNTGVKTFEAAAYLKKNGADINMINNMFRESLDTAKVKALALGTAEEVEPGFVMAVSPSEGVAGPTVVAAQVANELLDIQGVKASFVMTNIDGRTYISARSHGDTNVQLVMEKMGGGGHLNIAGCQMEDTPVEEAKKALVLTLRKMLAENDIA
ncbi:MAG: DHH family phosphoesterase [Parasporobacterium sp.]|nr:DHH family phosphoesterase [Parasporobacterium sp.]